MTPDPDAGPDRFRQLPGRILPTSVVRPATDRAPAPQVEEVVPLSPLGTLTAYQQIAEGLAKPERSRAQRIVGRSLMALVLATIVGGLIIGAIDTASRLTAP
ncbi:hypothetical protein F4553_007169 [Allocatelliglobosispora scoriae]|uniref:Uncharacterized protein n=1 Tax=Allocatelliglobosispora scoriae TaxID=643052 RepID=A0A841C1D0_9ACTN|nr:hypothetical protein [Allocatelliglobosispora scoriae]MBB5873735.1 hypothetical protein [Allocatelliglobosispora scoriae]